MKRAVLAISGGMDSTSLLLHLLDADYDVRCYLFNYGQKHNIELKRAKTNIENLMDIGFNVTYQFIDLESVFCDSVSSLVRETEDIPEGHYAEENMKSTVVENRNAIFAAILYSKALAWANWVESPVEICLGIHKGDHAIYPDCRKESRDALAEAFRISNWNSERISYYTPFLDYDKSDILQAGMVYCKNLKLDFDYIYKNTNTCYHPDSKGRSCGRCGSCVERIEAFSKLKIQDPVTYTKPWVEVLVEALNTLNK
jgi:7-cyano-7-deazaguanine synthase